MKRLGASWWLIGVLLLAIAGVVPQTGAAQSTTQVTDTVRGADGVAQQGTVLISWPAFTTATGVSVAKGSTSVLIGAGGALSVQLAPNVGAMPVGTYYTVVYHLNSGATTREYWVVPVSGSPVTVAAVRSSVLPTSVAMQTVSKQYVDQAIARALVGVPNSDPSVPYVEKIGDTMSGPLILSGDPTQPLQAATKAYVDGGDAALQAGLAQKVSMVPSGNQTVTQPVSTKLEVNRLNGQLNVGQFKSATSSPDGVANTVAQTDCAQGCDALIERDYPAIDRPNPSLPATTHVTDRRGGVLWDYFANPHNPIEPAVDAGERVTVVQTESATQQKVRTGGGSNPYSRGLWIEHSSLTGGNNIFPEQITGTSPYFKSTFSALEVDGSYNTQGQHVLIGESQHCYGVGDCLLGGKFLYTSGGFRDSADEATHPFDLFVREDSTVFQGVCQTGCTTGSTVLKINATKDGGTQGDGRFLIVTTPSKVISSGVLVSGDANAYPFPRATFTGTNFPVSTMLQTAEKVLPRSTDMAPGTVTVLIATSGVVGGYSTNTAALPASSGVACVVDATPGYAYNPTNFESANYQIVDGTHVQLTLNKPHNTGATISVGGLCGYGVEQSVDTVAGIRQVFPIVGSLSSTVLQYAAGHAALLGQSGATSAYVNTQLNITSITRNGGLVTVQTSSDATTDLTGLQMTVAGVTDSSYNGTFAVTQTGLRSFTYAQAGANSTSLGGTLSVLSGGFKIYPMVEVLSVMNPANNTVDGTMTLGANTVNWAAGDTVEEPHHFLTKVSGDNLVVSQWMPRPTINIENGVQYEQSLGPGAIGYHVGNSVDTSYYYGYGGSHAYPTTSMLLSGVWATTQTMDAGETAAFRVNCKLRGCGKWNSAYSLMSLQSNVGTDSVGYDPLTSTLTFGVRGATYTMSPSALSAGTINATTINAGAINGIAVNPGSLISQTAGAVALTGGSIDGVAIGASTASSLRGTALTLTNGGVMSTFAAGGNALNATDNNGAQISAGTDGQGRASLMVKGVNLAGAGGAYFTASGYQESYFNLLAGANTTGKRVMRFGTSADKFVVQRLNDAGSSITSTPISINNDAPSNALAIDSNGIVSAAGALAGSVETLSFSATPTLSAAKANSRMVLSGNVTASTLAAGVDGQRKCVMLVQDATGGRTFAWPANVLGGMAVGSTANKRSQQCFVFYATDNAWVAESAGVANQ